MVSEFTQDEILEDYLKLDNRDDLLNSDILILPFNGEDGFRNIQPLDMKMEFDEIDIKFYAKNQDEIKRYVSASCSDCVTIGTMIVSTLAGLITIADFLFNTYRNEDGKISIIDIQLFNKTVNNTYIYHDYKGDVNNFYNHEVEKMEDDFKHNGP